MKKMSSVCNYFVIASGTSTTHVRALAEHIEKKLKEKGQGLWHIEGAREASWVLLDYGDVVAHIFLEETRRYYNLEHLWSDAPQERFEELAGRRVKKVRPAPRKPKRKVRVSDRRKKPKR